MPSSVEAQLSGIDGCFDETENLAMCNGLVAIAAGGVGTALAVDYLIDMEGVDTGKVVNLISLGLYTTISGALLLGATLDSPGALGDSGPVLGAAELGIGAFILVTGVIAAVFYESQDQDEQEWKTVGDNAY